MTLIKRIIRFYANKENPAFGVLEILKYIGPGLLVTVGFIDPGNWASNLAAGAGFGYRLLWMVTLSTIMLIFLQHNAAHLGIATGLCLAEAATRHFKPLTSRLLLASAMAAAVATALAEILGAAIGLKMLTGLPLIAGAGLTCLLTCYLLLSNSYHRLEKYVIGFVSLIGFAFVFELTLVRVPWGAAARGWLTPCLPPGSLPIVMSVLGAVVMPHNLFLHSEVIQSRQWQLEDEAVIARQLKFEITDTIIAMLIGWAINSAMIIVAAAAFFDHGTNITELEQAQATLKPLLGSSAAVVFALALLLAGLSSALTAGMAGGSIFAGMFGESYDIADRHSRTGALITLLGGLIAILMLKNPFKGLLLSQIALSIQLPWTIFGLIFLTSSTKVMGRYRNSRTDQLILVLIGAIVFGLNLLLLRDLLGA